jgi:uncharacterized membrane protein
MKEVFINIADVLIYYIHAPMGGLSLLSGGVAMFVKKGGKIHKISGRIFYYAMLIVAFSAFIISVLPNHKNTFLFSIGLFSTYFLVSGLRSVYYKSNDFNINIDKMIAYTILLIGVFMNLYPLILFRKINIILTVFGITAVYFGVRDLVLFNNIDKLKNSWLKLHLGKMTGGYIAAVSAFFVVNQLLPNLYNWFLPGIIGGTYIFYWIRNINRKKP